MRANTTSKHGFSRIVLPAGLVAAIALPNGALAQSTESVANQLERLKRDLQVLSRQVYKNGATGQSPSAASGSAAAAPRGNAYIIRVEDRLTQLEGESRANTGNVENINHTVNQISARLDTLFNDINFRLSALEQRLNALSRNPQLLQGAAQPGSGAPSASPKLAAVPRTAGVQTGPSSGGSALASQPWTLGTITQTELNAVRSKDGVAPSGQAPATATAPGAPQQQTVAVPTALPKGSVQDQYKYAFGLVRKAEFGKAADALGEFIKIHPDEPLTSNARYWLGRTHYVRKNYRRAAEVFLASYQWEPKRQRAADNLLWLGMSLAGLDKKKEACATFTKLEQDFPNASSVVKKQLAQQRSKTGCS